MWIGCKRGFEEGRDRVKHYGDITKLSGYTLPPVDIITGGSPCQDLSVAGKRAGLAGERSGLFMEQVRLIKEMRENDKRNGRADVDIRPRFMVWENVPGAFSSNDGEDFRAVLEETARIADSSAVIPRPPEGKWLHAGCVVGKGWSIAWRLHDAQFWGVPQRRKRIALVADFAGRCAPEILFERKGLRGNIEESENQKQGTTSDVERSVGEAIGFPLGFRAENTRTYDEKATTLCNGTRPGFTCGVMQTEKSIKNIHTIGHDMRSAKFTTDEITDPLTATDYKDPIKISYQETTGALTIGAHGGSYNGQDAYNDMLVTQNVKHTVLDNHPMDSRMKIKEDGVFQTMGARQGRETDPHTLMVMDNVEDAPISVVRRLTPLECERLQGFPDGWTDIGDWVDSQGKAHAYADAPRYKALGNSIALPFWEWMAGRMIKQLNKDKPTMASLFDGIGGFPLVFSRYGCEPVWASEIEEFPMAVTERRFNG